MSYRELYASPTIVFSGYQKPFSEADYVILGVPFDVTSTYRTGARFGPTAIREASLNIESYSFSSGVDVEDLRMHDLGDLHVTGDAEETLKRLEKVVTELLDEKKIPVLIGGEHTITLGSARAFKERNCAIISFDAHLDLRNEYMNLKTSHTTFMRRINEQVKPERLIEIGTRAVCKEELSYAKKAGINYFTANQIRGEGVEEILKKVNSLIVGVKQIYLTIDLDVLDPAFAPAVQNPEANGLCSHIFYDLLAGLVDKRIAAFDVVEVAPNYDNGNSAVQAARTIFEVLCHIEKAKRKRT